jgi:hypothetical protein
MIDQNGMDGKAGGAVHKEKTGQRLCHEYCDAGLIQLRAFMKRMGLPA